MDISQYLLEHSDFHLKQILFSLVYYFKRAKCWLVFILSLHILGSSLMPAAGTMYLTTSTGYPYTYHNGVAYFHTPEVASVPQPWPVSDFLHCAIL